MKSLIHNSSGLANAEASEGSGTGQKEQRIDGNFRPVSSLRIAEKTVIFTVNVL